VEIGSVIRPELLPGIASFVADHDLQVTSVRAIPRAKSSSQKVGPPEWNFCSLPNRESALSSTLETIDYACRLGARLVILGFGSVPLKSATRKLLERLKQGRLLDRRYVRTKLRAVTQRETLDLTSRLIEWLHAVLAQAPEAGIQLALENPIALESVPTEGELRAVLQTLPSLFVGYWHDFGRAQICENLTLTDHQEWFHSMLPHLIGCQVQDVKYPDRARQLPFTGGVPFSKLIPLVPARAPLVWNIAPSISAADIRKALAAWKVFYAPSSVEQASFGIKEGKINP
jgi:Xylose isomerase-like TIM barrel